MLGLFSGERVTGTYSTSRDEARVAAAGTCPHRHGWILPNFSRGVAVRGEARRQRFAFTAAAIFSVVKCFVAGMGVPRAFRTDNGTEYSNSMLVAFCNVTSDFVASLRHRTHHSRMDPRRARYRELSRLDTQRDFEFYSYARTSAWKRSEVVPTRQERVSSWSRYYGHRSATTGQQHQ